MDFNNDLNFSVPFITWSQYEQQRNLVSEKQLGIQFSDLSDIESGRVLNFDLIEKRILNLQINQTFPFKIYNNYNFTFQSRIKIQDKMHDLDVSNLISRSMSKLTKMQQTSIQNMGTFFDQKKSNLKILNQNEILKQNFNELQKKFNLMCQLVKKKVIYFKNYCQRIKKLFILRDFTLFSKIQNIKIKQQKLDKILIDLKKKGKINNKKQNFLFKEKYHQRKSKTLSQQAMNSVYYQTGLKNTYTNTSSTMASFYTQKSNHLKSNKKIQQDKQRQQCSIQNFELPQKNEKQKNFQFKNVQIKFFQLI